MLYIPTQKWRLSINKPATESCTEESVIHSWFFDSGRLFVMCMLPSAGENPQLLQSLSHVSVSNRTYSVWGISPYLPFLLFPNFYKDKRTVSACCFKSQNGQKTQWAVSFPHSCSNTETWMSVIILGSTTDPGVLCWAAGGFLRVKALQWSRVSLSKDTLNILCWNILLNLMILLSFYHVTGFLPFFPSSFSLLFPLHFWTSYWLWS